MTLVQPLAQLTSPVEIRPPYPESKYWPLGKLTGKVEVTLKDKNNNVISVEVPNVVVPPRKNIFENESMYAGSIMYD